MSVAFSNMLIRTYGLNWKRDLVHWSGQGEGSGHLKGVRRDNKKSKPVDFADQNAIYALYDDNELLYIGQTGSGDATLLKRLRTHKDGRIGHRWTRFSWFGTRYVKRDGTLSKAASSFNPRLKEVLDSLEAIVLTTAKPPENRRGGNFGNAVEFIQFRDSEVLGPTQDEMIQMLYEDMKERKAAK